MPKVEPNVGSDILWNSGLFRLGTLSLVALLAGACYQLYFNGAPDRWTKTMALEQWQQHRERYQQDLADLRAQARKNAALAESLRQTLGGHLQFSEKHVERINYLERQAARNYAQHERFEQKLDEIMANQP